MSNLHNPCPNFKDKTGIKAVRSRQTFPMQAAKTIAIEALAKGKGFIEIAKE